MQQRKVRIVGLPPTERSLLAHLLEEHGFSVLDDSGGGRKGGAAIEAEGILTPRQCEVLDALDCHGCVKVAATALSISPKTIQAHLTNIHVRLGVNSHRQAVCWACQRGILTRAHAELPDRG